MFTFPNTASEAIVTVVPLLTVILGAVFLLAPKQALRGFGLQARPGVPDAIAEARSSFAAPFLTAGLACLFLQHPLAVQPSLMFMLAAGWTVSALGRIAQMALDGGLKRKRIHLRFFIAVGLAIATWSVSPFPEFRCSFGAPAYCAGVYAQVAPVLTGAAVLTLVLGLVAFFLPGLGMRILRLQPRSNTPFSSGEIRGLLAGFYISIGGTFLAMPQPLDFLALVLGAVWLLTGAGRAVSMLIDRAWSKYNFLATVFELALGAVVVAHVMGYFGPAY